MYANISRSTLRNAKKLFALYRRGKISPYILANWYMGYSWLPTYVLGQVHRFSVGKKRDIARAEALLSLAEHLVDSQIYNCGDRWAQLHRNIFGLKVLTRFHSYWIRPLSDFPVTNASPDDLIMALYDHLFVQFPVPKAFHNVLFREEDGNRIISQIDIGQGRVSRIEERPFKGWKPCGIKAFFSKEADFYYGVVELLSSLELKTEGCVMHHCVGSYTVRCSRGICAIFSCRRWKKENPAEVERFLTIEVNFKSRRIVQARGKYNAPPSDYAKQLLQEFANFNVLKS